MNRSEYVARSSPLGLDRAEQMRRHREYYAQFVHRGTIEFVVARIGSEALLASTDHHFNDIPLAKWDALATYKDAEGKDWVLLPVRDFKQFGDYATQAGLVCAAKEAARQFVEQERRAR